MTTSQRLLLKPRSLSTDDQGKTYCESAEATFVPNIYILICYCSLKIAGCTFYMFRFESGCFLFYSVSLHTFSLLCVYVCVRVYVTGTGAWR